MPGPEEDLVNRARGGDSQAIDSLLAAQLPALRAYVRMHLPAELRQRESCSDLVQSVCREALEGQEGFEYRGPEAFRGWLYAWAKHKIHDRLRYWHAGKRAVGREQDADVDAGLDQVAAAYGTGSASEAVMHKERLLLLEQAFERLSEEHREVIGLCRIAGLSREEVGRRLGGKSAGAVRSLLNRALVALSTQLDRSHTND